MLDKYLPFTDHSKYIELKLIEYGLKNQQEWISFQEITASLGITNYKLKQLIKNINASHLLKVNVRPRQKSFINISGVNTVSLQKMVTYTAVHSFRFKVFLFLFMNADSQSRTDLEKDAGVSPATYFRTRKALFQDLGVQTVQTITTSEAQLRLLITEVLYLFRYDKLFVTNKVSEVIRALTETLSKTLEVDLTKEQQEKFFYFCWVNYLRYQMKMTLLVTDKELFLDEDDLAKIPEFTDQVTDLLPELSNVDIDNFQRSCLSFLKLTTDPKTEKIFL